MTQCEICHSVQEHDPECERYEQTETKKSKLVALLLCTFLGMFGIHRFYTGRPGSGVVMFLLTITGIGATVVFIWNIIDWVVIVTGGFRDDKNLLIKKW